MRTSSLAVPCLAVLVLLAAPLAAAPPLPPPPPPPPPTAPGGTEALAGFDDLSNGAQSQNQFDLDRETFEEREDAADGLGPTYNAQGCAECHQTPVTGGSSQVTVLRAGRFDGSRFTDHPGGSVIQDRATDALLQEHLLPTDNVRALRASLSVLGDGYVEAIADATLIALAARQPSALRGTVVRVPVLESNGALAVGRFGWKGQHASLLSFAADAYLNEMGITSLLQPTENTMSGVSVAAWDPVPDPEDTATAQSPMGEDLEAFVRFMRSTRVPPRDETLAALPAAVAGGEVFRRVGCATCHVADLTTAPAGTAVNAGAYVVPEALANRLIHPYSDFLLHDVGTGDGIVQNGGAATRNMLRTPPLWGLRTRGRLMHDGASLTVSEAILRHAGQARSVVDAYRALSSSEREQLLTFLASL